MTKAHNVDAQRSEEHTSELQSLMRIPYVVPCVLHILKLVVPPRIASDLMCGCLSMAQGRACEAGLADRLAQDLDAGRLPDIAALRTRFSPDPAALPEVVVELGPLTDYDALLLGEAA